MGCTSSNPEESAKSKGIEQDLRRQSKIMKKELKLLLLGELGTSNEG
jgi:hypothetical protein